MSQCFSFVAPFYEQTSLDEIWLEAVSIFSFLLPLKLRMLFNFWNGFFVKTNIAFLARRFNIKSRCSHTHIPKACMQIYFLISAYCRVYYQRWIPKVSENFPRHAEQSLLKLRWCDCRFIIQKYVQWASLTCKYSLEKNRLSVGQHTKLLNFASSVHEAFFSYVSCLMSVSIMNWKDTSAKVKTLIIAVPFKSLL